MTGKGALTCDQRISSTSARTLGPRSHLGRRFQPWRYCGPLLVASFSSFGTSAHAAPTARPWTSLAYPPAFEHISVEQGLSQSSVHAIAQDQMGFLWMGTDAGLNRYDGFRFRTFHPERNTTASLTGDWIEHIVPDRHGYLWIAARNEGLTLLDPASLTMVPIPASTEPGGLPAGTVNAIVQDRDGTIWIGTDADGLFRVANDWSPPAQPRFQRIVSSANVKGAPEHRVSALFLDHAGTLWLASPELGLGRLLAPHGDGEMVFAYLVHDPGRPRDSAPMMVNAMAEDPFGKIWLGSDEGLYIFDPSSASFALWTSSQYPRGTGRVADILRDSKDTLWVACDGLGLFKARPRARRDDAIEMESFAHDPKDPSSLSRNGLQCLFEDASGQLWVSAYQGGLNKLVLHPGSTRDRERPSIFQYRNNAADPSSLSGDTVSAIGEDRFGNLWVGTDGFGLNRVIAPTVPGQPARFERFRNDPAATPGSLQTDVILTTHLDAQKQLWLGSYMGGLVRVDQASATARPTFTHFRHNPYDPDSLSSDFIRDIVDDGKGGFWIACDSGGGLNHFDPRTGKAKHYEVGPGPGALKNGNLMRMVMDHHGTLWIATQLGLHRFNPATEEFRAYEPGGPHTPSDVFIYTIYLDPMGALWIGTKSGGLNRTDIPPWEGPAPSFAVYGTAEGLPEGAIMSILPDSKGNLWLATHRALCRFDTRASKGYTFTFQRELRRAEFIWNAAHVGAHGEMFFGSNDGLTVFHPDDIVPNPIPPVLAFTEFRVRNQARPLPMHTTVGATPAEVPDIVLAPGDSMFSLEFAALHFAAPDQNQYAYRLEGLDPGWNEIGNRHSVTYSALAPGSYTLAVRASNCDGISSRDDLKLHIRVLPPWHGTWWFRALLTAGVLLLVVVVVRVRMRVLRRRNRQLSDLVAARTRELADLNEALRSQSLTDPLTGLHNRRFLDSSMPECIATVERQQRAVTCGNTERMKLNIDVLFIMIDIDHFKQVNDQHGHHAGDRVLQQFGDILRGVTRTSDSVARWGGEEFLIVARNASRADATTPVERIRKAVADHVFDIGGGKSVRCTCSLGFGVFPLLPGDTAAFGWEQIVAIADACLYVTKHNGRNAWAGIVPARPLAPEVVVPRRPAELVRSSCFSLLTSIHGPIRWSADED